MKITAVAALAALGLGTLGMGMPARADLQIDQKTVIDCPGLKQMFQEISPDQHAPLLQMLSPMLTGTPWLTTTYFLQGSRMRTDMGQTSVIVNAGSGGAITLDRQSHRYSQSAYDPFQPAAGQVACRITPTGRTSILLGHTVRGYAITMTCSVLPNSTVSGEMWAAPDLPSPPTPHYTGTASAFATEMGRVKGMPLAYTLVYHNTPLGDITVVSDATAIRDTPLTADIFRIPTDFQRGTVQTATALPSTGFPLGDGMPLDSLGAVTDAMATGEQATGDGNALGIAGLQGLLGAGGGQVGALSQGNLSNLLGPLQGGSGGQNLSSMLGQLNQELQALMQDGE